MSACFGLRYLFHHEGHGDQASANMRAPGFDRREILMLGLLMALGLGGLAFFVRFYDLAFPSASINLTVGREEALNRAERFLRHQGFALRGYRRAVGFHWEDQAKNYLEKEVGLKRANRLMRKDVNVWHWHCRWFKPLQKEEFSVSLSPDGRLVGFNHVIEETAKGASLPATTARTIAEHFLRQQHLNLADYRLLESDREERPHRVDHTFTWERKDFKAKESTCRIFVAVRGDQLGDYLQFLKIPEAWDRAEARKSSRRGLLLSVAGLFSAALGLAAFVVMLLKVRERQIRLQFGIAVGLLLAALGAIAQANMFPLRWLEYDTTESVGAFLSGQVVALLVGIVGTVVALLVVALPAEALGREVFPAKVPLSQFLTARFWCSREVFTASFVGCCLAFVWAAYVTLFYIIGCRFGVWSPAEVKYSDVLATPLPWIYPLTLGLHAAVNEELMFRLFAIALLLRCLKRPCLAITLPAIVWGFLHSGYPQEPIYVRGIEVSIVGIVDGLLFLRFGFFAPFIAHYAYNALMGGMILLRTHEAYLQISGAVVVALMLAPLLPGAALLLRRRPLVSTDEIQAGETPVVQPPVEVVAATQPPLQAEEAFTPLPRSCFWVLGALAACGVMAHFLSPVRERFGDFVRVTVNRKQAQAIADNYLRSKGVAIGKFREVTSFDNELNDDETDYAYQRIGRRRLNELCRDRLGGDVFWRTRYFVPLRKEEYEVGILSDGRFLDYSHTLEETAPGARLTQQEARRRAEEYLRREKQIDLGRYRLAEASTERREKRTDHYFTWEDKAAKVGEGTFRLSLTVQGAEVMNFRQFLKVPEKWYRAREERGVKDTVITGIMTVAGLAFVIYCVVLFIRAFARRQINWRLALPVAAGVALLSLLDELNKLPDLWSGYSTSTPLPVFLTHVVIGYCTEPVGVFLLACASVGLGEALFRQACPGLPPVPQWLGHGQRTQSMEGSQQEAVRLPLRVIWGQALVLACLLNVALLMYDPVGQRFEDWLDRLLPHISVRDDAPDAYVLGGYTSFCPAAETVLDALGGGVLAAALLMGAVGLYRRVLKRPKWLLALLAAVLLLTTGNGAGDWIDFTQDAVRAVLDLALSALVAWALVRWILRRNLPAYALTFFMVPLLDGAMDMLSVPNAAVRANGAALLGLFLALSAFGLWLLVSKNRSREEQPSTVPL